MSDKANTRRIRWGIIGCGDVTEKKSGPAFSAIEHSELFAVMRRSGEKAKDYARRHGVPVWYDDASQLIHDSRVNAVYVATPPSTHALYAIQAMEAGKPVYVEKPMASSYTECLKMIQTSRKTGQPLYVAYYRRQLPYFLKVKQLIDQGAIGTVRLFNIRLLLPPRAEDHQVHKLPWRVIPEIAGAGYFYDLASHQLDLLDFFFGPIERTTGMSKNQAGRYPAEDMVAALFDFETGVAGLGQWSFNAHESAKTDRMDFVGDEGMITCSAFEFDPIVVKSASGTHRFRFEQPATIQQAFIEMVVNELLSGKHPSANAISASRTNKVMDTILGKPFEDEISMTADSVT